MGSRGSDFDSISQINQSIQTLVKPTENSTGSISAAEHIQGYIEAISRQDKELVKMMDKHAKFQFADSWKDSEGKQHQISEDFLKLRKSLLEMNPKDLKKLKVPFMKELLKGVNVSNGEITLNLTDGTKSVFDKEVSMWPF